MPLKDDEQSIVDFYRNDSAKNNPDLYKQIAGQSDEDVLEWAKGRPSFARVAKLYHSGPDAWGAPAGQAATQPESQLPGQSVRDAVGVMNTLPMAGPLGAALRAGAWLNGKTQGLADSLEESGDKDLVKGGDTRTENQGNENSGHIKRAASMVLGMAKVPAGAGDMLAALLGGGLHEGANFPVRAVDTGIPADLPKAPVNTGSQGIASLIQKPIEEMTPQELAKSEQVASPGIHNIAAKAKIASNIDTLHETASDAYEALNNPRGPIRAASDATPVGSDNLQKEVEANVKELHLLPPELQSGAMKKILSAGRSAAGGPDATINAVIDTKLGIGDGTPAEEATDRTLTEANALHQAFNAAAAKAAGTPQGVLISKLADANLDDIGKAVSGNEELQKPYTDARDKWSKYTQLRDNPHLQKFLNAAPQNAHNVALGDTRVIDAVRDAGGSTAINNVGKSAMYDMIGKMAKAGDSTKAILQHMWDNRDGLAALYQNNELAHTLDLAKAMDHIDNINKTSETAAAELQKAPLLSAPEPVPVRISPGMSKLARFWGAARDIASVVHPPTEGAMHIAGKLAGAAAKVTGDGK